MAIRISKYHKGAFWTPILREGEVVGGHRSMVVSYTLPTVTIALSNVCDAQFNREWSLLVNFRVFTLD